MVDYAVPNEEWSAESVELFNKLNKLTSEGGSWEKQKSNPFRADDGSVNYLRPMVEKPGKFFEYALFINCTTKMLKGVVQFGMYTRGPRG